VNVTPALRAVMSGAAVLQALVAGSYTSWRVVLSTVAPVRPPKT
jgi:hypothetical protein